MLFVDISAYSSFHFHKGIFSVKSSLYWKLRIELGLLDWFTVKISCSDACAFMYASHPGQYKTAG